MLGLHLAPDGVGRLDASLEGILDSHLVELGLDGGGEGVEELLALCLCDGQLLLYGCVLLGVLILEAEVLELHLYLVQSESVGDRGIDVECLACYLVLLVWCHVLQGAHVVQAVGDFDEYDSYVLRHGEQ